MTGGAAYKGTLAFMRWLANLGHFPLTVDQATRRMSDADEAEAANIDRYRLLKTLGKL